MSNLLESKVVRTIIWVLAGLIVVFIAFGLGVRVGEDRAGFANGFDRHYFQDFLGTGPGGVRAGSTCSTPKAAFVRYVVAMTR